MKKGYAGGGMIPGKAVGGTGTPPPKLPAQAQPTVVPKVAPGGAPALASTQAIGPAAKSMPPAAVRTKPMGDQPVKHGKATRGFPGAKV